MAAIRYLCISDLHLGADNSLLTNVKADASQVDPRQASTVLLRLAACLSTLLTDQQHKPTLILNGDLLELALALDNKAVMAFERFMEAMFLQDGGPLFANDIIFIPGNHDHHLWETARETQYVEYLRDKKQAPGTEIEAPWHTTKMFDAKPVNAFLLSAVVHATSA
jgi:metallophosphoesterase superfamily enzyme